MFAPLPFYELIVPAHVVLELPLRLVPVGVPHDGVAVGAAALEREGETTVSRRASGDVESSNEMEWIRIWTKTS